MRVRVRYNYIFANPIKRNANFYELLNSLDRMKEVYLNNWMDTDLIYDPTCYFKITKLQLNKSKQPAFIELTEMENDIHE